ncbi:tripartite tricarboxylate transporter substrate binding protein [Microbacterium sp. KUDC0406]|uniref:Bug family tripartite tricarboxylate transporter substrate binding protein n=1 Tax=Microbacterium sp. KUDC0406 TaxID=2909588 RepID=UPI001F2ADC1F|nr:tripartite tricarboxylate transporter substrate binding protein [Microbacterium sp. KUDC0406]UJP10312.1 tripartite tricarboxylate transporter substrate binding protein [Microbacterium sp. KUDC0406]
MAKVLTEDDIVKSAPVSNVGGAGGTIGLAQLANVKDPGTLMVNGLVMVGAIETNDSKVRLEDTTPIARLTDEPLVVVVPADSKYKTLEDLVEDIVDNGQKVTVTGGSAGGADHILAGLLLEAAGLSSAEIPQKLNYTPNAGGGEAVSLILGGKVGAGISGVGEFAQHIESGKMRALAVSSDEPSSQLPDVPTITDEGYDVVLTNWRGVIAPGDITDADRAELERIVTEMHDSDAWKKELETKGWADAFLTGDDLDAFVEENISDVTGTLKNIGLI